MTITAAEVHTGPRTARDAVSSAARRAAGSGAGPVFSEVRAARRLHGLQVAAVTTGLVSVTVAASAAIVLGLSA